MVWPNCSSQALYVKSSAPSRASPTPGFRSNRAGKIELELVPQGNLACRIQAAGMGLGPIYTPTGFGTLLAEGKPTLHHEGKDYVLENPIRADFALIKAHQGDRWAT